MLTQVREKLGPAKGWVVGIALLASTGILAACGSGGGGGGGTGATAGVSSGAVQGFGSIIVNGVEFETESAQFEREGLETASQSDLREGMVVRVEGSFSANGQTGVATRVTFEDNLEGPINTIATSSTGQVLTLSILGQDVIVENGITLFDNTPPLSFGTLAVGQVVEVSGHMQDGAIRATFIELKAATLAEFQNAGGIFEIKGTVANLSGNNFTIGNLTIDATGATIDGTLANGALVEVKGTSLTGNTLVADTVEVGPNGLGANLAKVELEGFVSNLAGNTFTLGGQPVDYSNATFRGGIEADLSNGVKVEAEGPINGSGILTATKITFKETVRIEDRAAGPIAGNVLTLQALGLQVTIDDTLTDNRATGGFAAGDGVRLRAREGAGGTLIAIRIENTGQGGNNQVELQGPATNIANPNLDILGITVDTSTVVENDPSGSNFEIEDVPVTRAAFFAALAADPNPIVKARADQNLVWDHAELEIEDD